MDSSYGISLFMLEQTQDEKVLVKTQLNVEYIAKQTGVFSSLDILFSSKPTVFSGTFLCADSWETLGSFIVVPC